MIPCMFLFSNFIRNPFGFKKKIESTDSEFPSIKFFPTPSHHLERNYIKPLHRHVNCTVVQWQTSETSCESVADSGVMTNPRLESGTRARFVNKTQWSLGRGPVLERDFVHSPPFVKIMIMHLWFTMKWDGMFVGLQFSLVLGREMASWLFAIN